MEEKGSSSSSSSRWNPTKEQIAILEGLYKQGVRTPTAEQIQQITARLREFGGTEGKNVFYWFQNHKARQRQKLKQERFAYYTRLLNHVPVPVPVPVPAPATTVPHLPPHAHGCSNVMCGPYCMPVPQVGSVGFYQQQIQYPNHVFMPRSMQITSDQDQAQRMDLQYNAEVESVGFYQQQTQYPNHVFTPRSKQMMPPDQDQAQRMDLQYNAEQRDLEAIQTLQLFPPHPTGILEAERSAAGSSFTSASMEYHERVEEGVEGGEDNNPPPFFNFFRN